MTSSKPLVSRNVELDHVKNVARQSTVAPRLGHLAAAASCATFLVSTPTDKRNTIVNRRRNPPARSMALPLSLQQFLLPKLQLQPRHKILETLFHGVTQPRSMFSA